MTPGTVAPMPSKGRPKEIVRLSPETVQALVKQAEAEGVDKSTIMRRAIERELGIEPETSDYVPSVHSGSTIGGRSSRSM